MATYKSAGAINCRTSINADNVKGKTAIVTGGALGIGEAYVRALVAAGAFVVVADINEEAGVRLEKDLASLVAFIRCDVTSWESQLSCFKKAIEASPTSSIDIVVANAGISSTDPIFLNDGDDEPDEPKLQITNINVKGVLFTTRLALWFFRKQYLRDPKKDQCLVLQGSVTGYVDIFGAPQYTMSKFAVRGLMRSLRQSEAAYGIRVNMVAPWYVRTTIMTDSLLEAVEGSGVGFATLEDAGLALLRIVSDASVHGRSIAVMPRDWPGASGGYVDLDQDDYEQEHSPWMRKMQQDIVKPVHWIHTEACT